MPVVASKAPLMQEIELSENIMRPEAPIVKCRIVYMGNNRNRSVCLPGQLQIQHIQTGTDKDGEPVSETIKSAIDEGMQTYDFSSHDSRGRLIEARLMPDTAGKELAGKPFAYSEHLGHIRHFYLEKTADGAKEFKVLAEKKDQHVIQDYVRQFISRQQRDEKDLAEVASS